MKIIQIEIFNYRNLDGLKIIFNETVNFIVGENNLGKSNFINLLNVLFNNNTFKEEDFFDINKPIVINMRMSLDDNEKGFFDDLFDPEDENAINIIATQENIESYICFKHKESETHIHSSTIRNVNFIMYDSLRNPVNELKFEKNKGVGKFLNFLVKDYMKQEQVGEMDFIKQKKLDNMLKYLNSHLTKIKSFKEFSFNATLENNLENLLAKIIVLKDDKDFGLQNSGYGVQFLFLFPLFILEKILNVKTYKQNRGVIIDGSNKKCVPIFLGLDEPEIHLHPYMQRALIKYLMKIFNNDEREFLEIIKTLFDIDKISGQIIIATHSPNILLDDYKQIIRFYKDGGELKVKCGSEIDLSESKEKHLLKNMPYIKEAFFSRCVIIVEGDSELGAFPVFADRMDINLDENGISIIHAGSADSVPPLTELLNEFGINNVAVIDYDKYSTELRRFRGVRGLLHTIGDDFEADIWKECKIADYIKLIEENLPSNKFFFVRDARSLGITIDPRMLPLHEQLRVIDNRKAGVLKRRLSKEILKYLRSKKSIVLGRTLAEYVTKIPKPYRKALKQALELARND